MARGRADGRRVERRPRRVVIREGDVGTGGKNDDGAAPRQQLQVAHQGKGLIGAGSAVLEVLVGPRKEPYQSALVYSNCRWSLCEVHAETPRSALPSLAVLLGVAVAGPRRRRSFLRFLRHLLE